MQIKILSIFTLILSLSFLGCSGRQNKGIYSEDVRSIEVKRTLTPDEIDSELKEIVNLIKSKPVWLEPTEICPADVVPAAAQEILDLEEVCENSPKICLDKCRKEDGNACYALAIIMQKRLGNETAETSPLFLRSCKLGIISGCTSRAANEQKLDFLNVERAKCLADTFEKTCQMNDAWGCALYGSVLFSGEGRKSNVGESLNYLQKACDLSGEKNEVCKRATRFKEFVEQQKENQKK